MNQFKDINNEKYSQHPKNTKENYNLIQNNDKLEKNEEININSDNIVNDNNPEWNPKVNDKCYVFSNSNGGWVEGKIAKIENNSATVYYGNDYEKEVDLNDKETIKRYNNEEHYDKKKKEMTNKIDNDENKSPDNNLEVNNTNLENKDENDIKEIKLEIEEKIKKNKKNEKNNEPPTVIVDKVIDESDVISLENIPLIKYKDDNDDFTFFNEAPKFI